MSKLGPELSFAIGLGVLLSLSACADNKNPTPTLAPAASAGAATPASESICGEKSTPKAYSGQLTQAVDFTSVNSPITAGVRSVAFGEKAVYAGLATKPAEPGGLLAFTGKDWRVCTDKPTQINKISINGDRIGFVTDPQRNIANETVGGAWLLDGGNWKNYGTKDGVDPRGSTMTPTEKGFYYGAWDGVSEFVNGVGWNKAFPLLNLPQMHAFYEQPDSKKILGGSLDKGVWVIDNGTTPTISEVLTAPDKLGGNKVRDIAGTRDGKIVAVATDKDEGKDGGGVTLYDESGKVMKIINSQTTQGALDHIVGVAIEERKGRAPRVWEADWKRGVGYYDLETGRSVLYDSKPAYSVAVCADGCPNLEFPNTVAIGYVEPMFTIAPLPASGSVGIPIPKESPTPVLAPANTDFKIKEFSAGPPNKDGIVAVQLCTENRPFGATIRTKLFPAIDGEIVTVEGLLKRVSILDWELGVPCTDTDPAKPDHLNLTTKNFPPGKYELLGQGRPPEAKVEAGRDIWTSPTVQSQIIPLTIQ